MGGMLLAGGFGDLGCARVWMVDFLTDRRALDRSESPPIHKGIKSALGPTAAPPTRVGHLSPPRTARRR